VSKPKDEIKVIILPDAQIQVSDAFDYINDVLRNDIAANKFIKDFRCLRKRIKNNPLGYTVHESNVVDVEFRKATLGNYLVFFRIVGNVVYIAFVLYGKRDHDRILVTYRGEHEE